MKETCTTIVLTKKLVILGQLPWMIFISGVAIITLSDSVPKEIVSQFNIARNLAVYSWFSYSFHQVSEMKAFSAVEHLKICADVINQLFDNKTNDRSLPVI